MANEEQLAILRQGVEVWNKWREEDRHRNADLSGANLSNTDLSNVNFQRANLSEVNLSNAILKKADFFDANLWNANLASADLSQSNLGAAILIKANLRNADLQEANLQSADLGQADLSGAGLRFTNLIHARITNAIISNSSVYGVNVWDLEGDFKEQKDLIISHYGTYITIDNIEVAQFIYLMLNNQKIRNIIDTVTTKTVLILGRFTAERKQILDALRDELRKRGFIPILFDFQPSQQRDLTETVQLLANMAKFIIADITEAKSIPQELSHIIPFLPSVPVQPILLVSSQEYSMFEHWQSFNSVLPEFLYQDEQHLIDNLEAKVILPVNAWQKGQNKVGLLETKIKELEEKLRHNERN